MIMFKILIVHEIVHEIERIFQNNIIGGYLFILFNFAYIRLIIICKFANIKYFRCKKVYNHLITYTFGKCLLIAHCIIILR